jgi:hypothetical protein
MPNGAQRREERKVLWNAPYESFGQMTLKGMMGGLSKISRRDAKGAKFYRRRIILKKMN